MKKKIISMIIIIVSIISIYKLYNYLKIKYAKIEVVLKEDLNLNFLEEKRVSDFIEKINGNIIDDYLIDSTIIGKKKINFDFINNQNIKVNYSYDITIKDEVAPLIYLNDTYNLPVNSDVKLTDKILCGDNYDSDPNCFIEGVYDLNTPGDYILTFKAIDNSGNTQSKDFTLHVYEPKSNVNNDKEKNYIAYNEIASKYKIENTKIGIDISKFQGDIDFSKLKDSGVEFVMIRVGYGYDNKNFLDKKFKYNIEQANKVGIDAGIYYYSYSKGIEEAKKEAKWVLKQIKKYKVNLPIAFDWEEWSNFNEYNLSFFGLTSMAEAFLKVIEDAGYEGMLYSSKNYLENIWMPINHKIWLAQYNDEVTYKGDYYMWQICDNGKIDGIDGLVDIDILKK